MWLRYVLVLVSLSGFINLLSFAQQSDSTIVLTDSTHLYKDSVIVYPESTHQNRDTTHLYQNIQNYSNRKKFTKALHRLLFKHEYSSTDIKKPEVIQTSYNSFEGKIIRNINIETLEPFGYSMADTAAKPSNLYSKVGNALHAKTKIITIRNLLIIKKNQVFDSLLVRESERLVHSRDYIYDVSFFVSFAPLSTDSVDIFIRVHDNWSIVPQMNISSSPIIFSFRDNNFGGLGHTFENNLTWYQHQGKANFNFSYYIPNIRNTYISSSLQYGTDAKGNFSKSIAVDRPFFSPFARWAAGIAFSQLTKDDNIPGINLPFNLYNSQDYWAGFASKVRSFNPLNSRFTKLIYAARFYKIHFLNRPNLVLDTLNLFANEKNYMASIGLTTRKYVKDKYIFKFGLAEDVPIGRLFNLIGGYQYMDKRERLYLGARVSSGFYYPWGYLSLNLEGGSYFRSNNNEQTVLTASANYITQLYKFGNWKIRQFIKPQITLGYNPLPADSLTINDGFGLNGFQSTSLSGTSRILLSLQTQTYSPWNVIGFRFGPYFLCSLGVLGNTDQGFKKSKVYSQIGVGVLIKNDHLVFKTFQMSIAFYPIIPGNKNNVFKLNSFQTVDYGFRDFVIGKPSALVLQ